MCRVIPVSFSFEVPDAARCSMITRLGSTAARLHFRLFPRLRTPLLSFLLVFQRYSSTKTGKLASHGFASMAAMSSFPPQRYHYFLVLDFEATCDKPQIHPQVIIQLQLVSLFIKEVVGQKNFCILFCVTSYIF